MQSWVPMIAIALGQVPKSFNVAALLVSLSKLLRPLATGIVMLMRFCPTIMESIRRPPLVHSARRRAGAATRERRL